MMKLPERETVVFDLETQKLFAEVGGRSKIRQLRMSVAVLYRYRDRRYITFTERQVKSLLRELSQAERIVGFAVCHFDYPVLARYGRTQRLAAKSIDIQEIIEAELGWRPSLDSLALGTLRIRKGGDGVRAVELFRAGKTKEVLAYCRRDVSITRRLYEYGMKHGKVYLQDGQVRRRVRVDWSD